MGGCFGGVVQPAALKYSAAADSNQNQEEKRCIAGKSRNWSVHYM